MLKMKFVLLLILLFFIVDSKKLRNKLKAKTRCGGELAKCGTFYDECCEPYKCKQVCSWIYCFGNCL